MKKPNNLDSAINILKKINFEDKVRWLKYDENEAVAIAHLNFGAKIRNEWGLWDNDSELNKYFKGLGITHPDDMSSIILRSFHRTMNNRDINLEELIDFYKKYWESYFNELQIIDDDDGENGII